MTATALALAIVLLAAAVVPFVRKEAWWIRVFDFPRMQLLVLGVLTALLALSAGAGRDGYSAGALITALTSVAIQAAWILPYTPFARREVQSVGDTRAAAQLSLLIANVLMDNRRADRLLELIAEYRPDVVVLLEPDAWWERTLRVLEEDYACTVKEPRDNKYGMLLYARLPLRDTEVRHLLKPEVPSIRTWIALPQGGDVRFYAVHPEPPAPSEASTSLPRDAELLMIGREAQDRNTPTIVAGDLNDVAWSYTTRLFQRISGLLDPRKGRGMFNTFHAKNPLLRWPLDHVFHSRHFLLAELRRLPAFGSDHFPVYVRLVLQPEAGRVQDAPQPDAEDARTAQEKIRKGRTED